MRRVYASRTFPRIHILLPKDSSGQCPYRLRATFGLELPAGLSCCAGATCGSVRSYDGTNGFPSMMYTTGKATSAGWPFTRYGLYFHLLIADTSASFRPWVQNDVSSFRAFTVPSL